MSVIDEIAAERARQISKEGWTPEHDDHHNDGSLARAAACYAVGERLWCAVAAYRYNELWPWEDAAWKPKDRRRDLIRAAALIVAEVERLDRAQAEKE